jgi:hypothetical protein
MTTPAAYRHLFDALEQAEVRYVIVGGVAVVLHGYVRPVADLDLVVDATPLEAQRAMQTLLRAGFVPSVPLPLFALTVQRMFDAARREIDVFVRYPIPFPELWAASERRPVGGTAVRVASIDHLLRAKHFFSRQLAPGEADETHALEKLRALAERAGGAESPLAPGSA